MRLSETRGGSLLVGVLNWLYERRRGVICSSPSESNCLFCLSISIWGKKEKKWGEESKMGDSSSFVDGIKGFWEERLSFLENYTRFTKRDTPLPSWSSSDVEEFIASDPLHGPTVFLYGWFFLFDSLSMGLAIVIHLGRVFGFLIYRNRPSFQAMELRDNLTVEILVKAWRTIDRL